MEFARKTISFFARNHAFHSVKRIGDLTGLDGGNLHSALAGKRKLPLNVLRTVAAVLGLRIESKDGEKLQLEIQSDSIIHLEINADERAELALLLESLTPGLVSWKSVVRATAAESTAVPGVYFLAIAKLANSYVVVHVKTPSDQASQKAEFDVLATDAEWLRLRAGLVSSTALDTIFGKTAEPGLADWAQLLLTLSRKGITPTEVLACTAH